jgi:hypothetical protein
MSKRKDSGLLIVGGLISVAGCAVIIRSLQGEATRITTSTVMNSGATLSDTAALVVGGLLVLGGLVLCYKA